MCVRAEITVLKPGKQFVSLAEQLIGSAFCKMSKLLCVIRNNNKSFKSCTSTQPPQVKFALILAVCPAYCEATQNIQFFFKKNYSSTTTYKRSN